MSSSFGSMVAVKLLVLVLVLVEGAQASTYNDEIIFPTAAPAPRIRSLLNSTSQPVWFTYCVNPPDPHEKLITVILGPQNFGPPIQLVQRELGRPKRSPAELSNKAAILFKRPRYKQVATKKTSFAAYYSRPAGAKYKSHHVRYLTQPPTSQSASIEAPATDLVQVLNASLSKAERAQVESLVADNIRLSWAMSCALNTCRVPKLAANKLREELASGLDERKITQGDLDEAERRRASWWPSINSLVQRKDSSRGALLVGRELEHILANVSHYLQFFSVAFEQMEFEERSTGSSRWNQSNYLSRHNLRVMCEIDNMLGLLGAIRSDLSSASVPTMTMLDLRLAGSSPLRKLTDAQQVGDRFRSPLVNLSRAPNAAPSDAKLERSVMPLSERELPGKLERDLRDWLILKDYEKTIAFYELVLASMFV